MLLGRRYLFFLCSNRLEKDFIKKKMKGYRKVEIESKIAMEKDVIQSSDESI